LRLLQDLRKLKLKNQAMPHEGGLISLDVPPAAGM
jgi:hypothetical protein